MYGRDIELEDIGPVSEAARRNAISDGEIGPVSEAARRNAISDGEIGPVRTDIDALTKEKPSRGRVKNDRLSESYNERMEMAGFGPEQARAATATYKQSQLAKANAENGDKIDWPPKGESISPEQYNTIRAYAESKGVFLRGFKNSDVDMELATEAVDAAAYMLERYPELQGSTKRPFTLELDRYMRSVDFAEVKEGAPHILHLNADAFRSRTALLAEYKKLADEGWFVKGTSCRSIIYHEMGHMVSDVYRIDGISVMQEVLGVEYEAQALSWCRDNLSQYSAKLSGEEIIAESFSAFFGLKNPPQEIIDFVQKCDKIIKKEVQK